MYISSGKVITSYVLVRYVHCRRLNVEVTKSQKNGNAVERDLKKGEALKLFAFVADNDVSHLGLITGFFFGPCTGPGSRKLLTQPTAPKKSDDQA